MVASNNYVLVHHGGHHQVVLIKEGKLIHFASDR